MGTQALRARGWAAVGRGRGSSAGFALIEILVAGSVVLLGALTFMRLFTSNATLQESNRDTALAIRGAERALEQLAGFGDHASLFALHNDDPNDDPAGLAPLPGFTESRFAVPGLTPAPGEVEVGRVLFPIDPLTGELREDMVLPAFGLPKDLNGDGVIDNDDRRGDYFLLPVRVRIRWQTRDTVRTHEVAAVLSPR